MKTKAAKRRANSARRRSARTALVIASVLASAPASAAPDRPEFSDEVIAKLSPGALRRLLLNLRHEDDPAGNRTSALRASADHDSHVMFGSHSSHGSHGQHTSFTNSAH